MKTRQSSTRQGVRKPKPRRQASVTLGLPTRDPQPLEPQSGGRPGPGWLVTLVALGMVVLAESPALAQSAATFDVPATVWAVDVTDDVLASGAPAAPVGGAMLTTASRSGVAARPIAHRVPAKRFYLLTLEVNAVFQTPQQFDVVTYEIMPLSRRGLIVDYAPRTQTTTDWSGEIVEEANQQQQYTLGANLQAGHPIYGTATLQAAANGNHNRISRQAWKAPLTTAVTSGLSQRGRGVFFRLTPNRDALIEGGQVLQLVVEVPSTWRGDVLQVHCAARGTEGLLERNFLAAVAVAGDEDAQAVAERFAAADFTADQMLRRLQVHHRPTHLLAELEASLFARREAAHETLDPQRVRQSLLAAMTPEQVAHFQQLPPSVQNAIETLLARKRDQLALAHTQLTP